MEAVSSQEPLLISVEKAAKEMGIGWWALYRLIDAGEFPYVCIGKRKWIKRQDILPWIDCHTQPAKGA